MLDFSQVSVRDAFLMATAFSGLIFLIWRSKSMDKMAKAALTQAETASKQLEINGENSRLTAVAMESALGNNRLI